MNTIELMDLYTGQTAMTGVTHTDDHMRWWQWTEGNWSCDCKRWPEWALAKGEKESVDNEICGEPRIRARYLHGTEPFNDWPKDEAERIKMAEEIKAWRLKQMPDLINLKP